jgi:hypothetical protein
MLCKGSIQEVNQKKGCWLPADPSSSFQLCRRCHFFRITEMLDSLTQAYAKGEMHPPFEISFTDEVFLQELLHPAREQALLNLLSTLSLQNKIQYRLLQDRLKQRSVFPILMTKRIQAHQPGPRCKMYRDFLKDPDLYKSDTLCWNCWSCIAWVVKQNNTRLLTAYRQTFGLNFSRITFDIFTTTGSAVFVDLFASLHLLGKDHHIRILQDHFFHRFPLEDFRKFLFAMFQHPVFLDLFFYKTQNDFLPLPFRDAIVVEEFYRTLKKGIKCKTNMYKEELMMRTWHPSRLFTWCFDIEELKDFDYAEISGSSD